MKNWSRFAFFMVALLWGVSFAFQKTLLAFINPFTFTFWQFATAFLVMLGFALIKRQNLFYRLREGILLGVFLAGLEILQTLGLAYSSSANTAFISNLGMLLIPYAGWMLFRHRVSVKDNLAMVLAVIGMYMLVGGVHGFGFGEAMLLLSAFSMALYFLYSQRFEGERSNHVIALLTQQFFVTMLISGLVVFFAGEQFSIPPELQGHLLLQIAFFTVIPYVLTQWASQWADEMIAAMYDGVVEPLIGGITSWVFFMEATTRESVSGALLMVVAFAFSSIFTGRHFLHRGLKALNAFVR